MLQFATEGIDLSDKPKVVKEIFCEITKLVSVSDIIGVQLIPKRWPHRVEILCANQNSKDILLEKGLTIQDQLIDLSEPGLGKVRVSVDDAPLDMSNDMIRELLNDYGKVLDVRNEYLHVSGNRVPWWNGTRHVDICSLKSELPPTLRVPHGHKEVKIKLWHRGQSYIECRWCKEHVNKNEHDCPRKPQRRCFNCGSTDHMKSDCQVGKQCFNCGQSGHIARECPNRHPVVLNNDDFPGLSKPDATPEPDPNPRATRDVLGQDLGSPCVDSPDARDPEEKQQKVNIKCLLVGSSNCRGLVIPGDDDLEIQLTSRITGGLKIKDATSKLNSIPSAEMNEYQAVILHVGSTDFPVSSEKDFDTHYMEYVESLSELSTMCPKSAVLISSVLPRNDNFGSKTNRQIRFFNDRLKTLARDESNLVFVDNSSYLVEGDQVQSSFYRKNDADKIHLNTSGREGLARMLQMSLKETVYRCKLENEWQIHVK